MEAPKENSPAGPPARGGRRPPRDALVRCPHCGRLVAPQPAPGLGGDLRCPACGLEIKERHLA